MQFNFQVTGNHSRSLCSDMYLFFQEVLYLVALKRILFESIQFTDDCIGQFNITIIYDFTSLYSTCSPKLPNPLPKSAIILFSGTRFYYQILSLAELDFRTYVAVHGNMLYCANKPSRIWPSTWKKLLDLSFQSCYTSNKLTCISQINREWQCSEKKPHLFTLIHWSLI